MRILFVTQWFDPEPGFKGLLFAKALVKAGHNVEVLTGFPNYPGGKLYDGYRIRFMQKEVIDGIPVIRVPLYPSHDRSAVRRVANYASFALSAAVMGPACVKQADVAYVYHPPGTVALPAMSLRLLRGIPFVYDVQDLWPDTLSATGMIKNKAALSLVERWSRLAYRMASRVVVLSPGFRDALIGRGVPAAKIDVIYNWCDESHLLVSPRDETLARQLGMSGRFNIVFAGNMGRAQGLDAVLEAATRVQASHPLIQFVLVGGGIDVDRLKHRAAELGLRNVAFLPHRPVSEIGRILSLADVLLVHLRDDPLFHITIPSKTQAYMAYGKPILMAVRGNAAALVQEAKAGLVCEPENPENIAEAACQLSEMPESTLQRMGANAMDFYRRELSLQAGIRRFEAVFKAASEDGKMEVDQRE